MLSADTVSDMILLFIFFQERKGEECFMVR